ncbi:pitrilysin family protein [Leptospira sp. GIMC2001]|nr:pitrilysin family protein [Leptospira sp. GIMC2001]WCL51358.1 pitrilysin family protein [Leptospira sp. GIMC2001]
MASYRENLQKKVYPNGLTLLFQPVEHVASVSCGLFLKRGSVHEEATEAGYFHFVEHMLFKGTTNRTSKEIVEAVERVGGMINALTSREYTNYYISLIRDELPLAMDILSDMIFNPLFNEEDINLEMKVILEEIKSYEDNPEDFLYDAYYLSVFDNAPIGRNIAGTKESVQTVNSERLKSFYKKHYTPENLILSISGNATLEEVESLVEEFFPINETRKPASTLALVDPKPKKFIKVFHKRKIEQVNLYLGAEGFARTDTQSPDLIMACNILGGGMASRLFQEVREKHGYCYGIQCFPSGYLNTGITSIFCATSPENVIKATDLILNEIDSILKKGFSENEMENSRTNIIGSLAMGYEMTESRMNNIAIQEIYFGRFYSLMDRIELFTKITIESLNETFRTAFGLTSYHLSAIGDLKAKEVKALPHSIAN